MCQTPDPVSVAERLTLIGALHQVVGTLSKADGSVRSIKTWVVWVVSELPAASTDRYFTVVVPSVVIWTGPV